MRVRPSEQLKWIKIIPFVVIGVIVAGGILRGADPPAKPAGAAAISPKDVAEEADEKLYVGWPKPDVALVFSGELDGYLEPCGCAGLENQKGGMKRRFTMLQQLRDPQGKGWPVVAVDAGGQEKDTGVQAELKVEFAYQSLIKMGYQAVGFGENDLKVDIVPTVLNLDAQTNPLVSANVGLGGFDSGLTKRYVIVEKGGMRIGITTVLGAKEVARIKNPDVKAIDPNQAIPQIVAQLVNAKCDHLVLLVNGDPSEAAAAAVKFKDFNFDWVMATHGAEVPPNQPAKIPGTNANLVEVGHKGMYVVVVGFYKNGNPSFRYQRVPLDHRFADAPEIFAMQEEYQRKLQSLGLEGLQLKPTAHESNRKFVGSKTCESCHTQAAEVFNKTPHSHATETLETKTHPPRLFDPECLACHVTGWHPQKFFPFESGYLSKEKTPDLVGNGCENCHGPGAKHAAAENGEITVTALEKQALRDALRLKIVDNEGNKEGQVYDKGKVVQMCMQCHDLDNSPEFDFQKYWPKVKHVGKD